MATMSFKSETRWMGEGLQCKSEARDFGASTDHMLQLGGTNQAMCPMELLLSAIGACVTMTTRILATKGGIDLSGVRATVEGDYDRAACAALQAARVKLFVASDAPDDAISALIDHVGKISVVMVSLAPGILKEFSWERESA